MIDQRTPADSTFAKAPTPPALIEVWNA